jgi:glucuronoarabinoxylan endo-1,4-beta-xylanase
VDFGTTNQIIRGFGGSEAWYGAMSNAQISALYGATNTDLGLSIMRLRIAPTTWTSSTQTADTSQWTTELGNGRAAQTLGATIFATPWSPPASMKTNGSVNEGSLIASSFADYAAYLESYVKYATSQGVNLYAISMQNEPDWNPCPTSDNGTGTGSSCYESCLWSAQEMDTWVAQNASVLTTKLIMPESFIFNSAMSDLALDDPNAVNNISIIGGHLYGSSPYYYTNAENKGKDVWMTEHFLTPAGAQPAIADGLALAEEIHNSMTVGQYNAYVYWWMDNTSTNNTGLIDTNSNPTYYGYALAQFARFVRPGYLRVNVTANPAAGVYVSAYSGSGHAVIVAINSNTSSTSVQFTIQNKTATTLTPYQTTSSGGLAALSPISVSSNSFTTSLPAQSITTFVQ